MALLSAHDVCKYFRANKAVDHVSMEVNAGEIVGLIGANGAGKTTFFNCLTGYYRATAGTVTLDGRSIEKLPAHKICRLGLARTFQIARPFRSLTVLENAVAGAYNHCRHRADAVDKAQACLRFVGLEEKASLDAGMLNTGEQRQLELARALATSPRLLLLDEVMAGLTPAESVAMMELIRAIRQSGVTILMIEHIMPALMSLSDRVYVLEQGQLLCHGTPQQVTADERVIASYLGKGTGE